MCDPISALTVAATATAAVGQLQSGIYASQMSRYEAKIADTNKGLSREGAIDAVGRGQEEQRQLGREVAQRVGAQTARIGANNVDITMGSAARTIEDTKMIGQEDSAAISENVRRQVKGMQIDAWNFESEKRAAKAEGKQAMVGAAFGAASTVLGGATQYSKYRADRKPK